VTVIVKSSTKGEGIENGNKKGTKLASSLAVILLVTGVIAYAAFPMKTQDQPVRLMLRNIGGNVLFDHKKHTSEDGYGIKCKDCHHNMGDEGSKATACGECHTPSGEDALRRADAFHQQCKGCHEEDGMGPLECSGCHMLALK
jgi:hypothetical protein